MWNLARMAGLQYKTFLECILGRLQNLAIENWDGPLYFMNYFSSWTWTLQLKVIFCLFRNDSSGIKSPGNLSPDLCLVDISTNGHLTVKPWLGPGSSQLIVSCVTRYTRPGASTDDDHRNQRCQDTSRQFSLVSPTRRSHSQLLVIILSFNNSQRLK